MAKIHNRAYRIKVKLEINRLREWIPNIKSKIQSTQHGYQFITRYDHPKTFGMLDKSDFFKFHKSNQGQSIAYIHQIVKYAHTGYKAYFNGFFCIHGETEVHHINSCVTDNHPDNLIYLSPEDNKLCAQFTHTKYFGDVISANPTQFDNHGRKITNHLQFLIDIAKKTLSKTFANLNNAFNVDTILDSLNSLTHHIISNIDKSLIKSKIISVCIKALNSKGNKYKMQFLDKLTNPNIHFLSELINPIQQLKLI